MALSNYAAFKGAQPHARVQLGKTQLSLVAGKHQTRWPSAPQGGTAPTTPVAPTTSSPAGCLLDLPPGLDAWIKSAQMGRSGGGVMTICDRLSHQAGLDGTLTSVQTTNLPTAPLTRYTSGAGVFAGLEIYTAVGATVTTLSVSYTNSAGVAGRTSPPIVWGGTNDRQANMFHMLPLQAGDVGVRSVESVTLAASTATAGNFGVTLFKPLLALPCFAISESASFDTVRDLGCAFENVQANAHLFQLWGALTTATFVTPGVLNLIRRV